jgi:hypothetical protein
MTFVTQIRTNATAKESVMIADHQTMEDFPRWAWPYINVAKLADVARVKDPGAIGEIPETALNAHVTAIISALTVRKVAANLSGDLGKQVDAAANKALSVAIDDCGSTGKKPWPRPPKHIELMEIAGRLAVAAAQLEGDKVLHDGLQEAVSTLARQAEQAAV